MSDKVLITGAGGQLGTELAKHLPAAVLTESKDLDITDFDKVKQFVSTHDITTIVNCAAYTAVDAAEDNEALACKVNVTGPENLAKTGCKIIHISTDYVFDGLANRPYRPEDKPHPVSVYGRTKAAGEAAVLANTAEGIVIRTAWLYSPNGKNFVKTMLRLGAEKDEIGVVCDQIGTPTSAADLAGAIVQILPQVNQTTKGIYHFTNEGVCSWYDFATEIMTMAHLNCCVNPIKTEQYPTKAQRPFYSVLDKSKIKDAFNIKIRHWRAALADCLKELNHE